MTLIGEIDTRNDGSRPQAANAADGRYPSPMPTTHANVRVSAGDPLHRASDRQSLALTAAAIDHLRRTPSLAAEVLRTLDHWDEVADPASQALRGEWRRIIASGDWERALALDEVGQQLRQASPLGKALDARERWEIIRTCKGRNSST